MFNRDSSQTTMGYVFPIQTVAYARHLAQVASIDGSDYYADIFVEEEVCA